MLQHCSPVLLVLASALLAQDSPVTPPPPAHFPYAPLKFKSIRFSGLVDTYTDYSPDHPASGFNAVRNFDVRANSFQLNMARIMIESDPAPLGFKLDLGFGRAMDYLNFQDKANGFNAAGRLTTAAALNTRSPLPILRHRP